LKIIEKKSCTCKYNRKFGEKPGMKPSNEEQKDLVNPHFSKLKKLSCSDKRKNTQEVTPSFFKQIKNISGTGIN